MNKWKIIHIHSTLVFLCGNPKQEKTTEWFFLYEIITFIGSTKFLCFPAATRRRLQPPSFSGYNWGKLQLPNSLATTRRRLQPPMFYGYNRKVATNTCHCLLFPPWSRSRMMEPLLHYQCEIYCCKPVPINQNHASTMHQPVPQLVINLYHKQVHQPCTKLYLNLNRNPSPILSSKSYL